VRGPRRRWQVIPRPVTHRGIDDVQGAQPALHILVTDSGAVTIAAPAPGVTFSAADVSRLRRVLLDAQAAALNVRGRW